MFKLNSCWSQEQTKDGLRLITDFSQKDCMQQTSYFYRRADDQYVATCEKWATSYRNKNCSTDIKYIPPAYQCVTPTSYLTPDPTSCMAYYAYTQDYVSTQYAALKKPECTNDAFFAPKQCKGGLSGRCFCVDKLGTRLFGQVSAKKSEDMTCACDRRKAELQEDKKRFYVSLHCNELGNYEELQCDSGLCWCAEPKTGKITATMVPESNMKRLPCYKEKTVGTQYLRQCESKKYAIARLVYELDKRGTETLNPEIMFCEGDGAFGPLKTDGGVAYCTWRDNSTIANWMTDLTSTPLASINCNCARDYKLGLNTMHCNPNGNYNPLQQSQDGIYFCVDQDGFAKTVLDPSFTANENCDNYYPL